MKPLYWRTQILERIHDAKKTNEEKKADAAIKARKSYDMIIYTCAEHSK